MRITRSVWIALGMIGALALLGCEEGRDAESFGRAVDEKLGEAGAGMRDAVDQANRAINEAAGALREAGATAVDDANRAIGDAGESLGDALDSAGREVDRAARKAADGASH